ncbi:hypothetical protein VTI74DRAFT_11237 [Chaetomium olivicolor]
MPVCGGAVWRRHAGELLPFGFFAAPPCRAMLVVDEMQDMQNTGRIGWFDELVATITGLSGREKRAITCRTISSGSIRRLGYAQVGGSGFPLPFSRRPGERTNSPARRLLCSVPGALCPLCLTQACKQSQLGEVDQNPLVTPFRKWAVYTDMLTCRSQRSLEGHVVGPSRQTQPTAAPGPSTPFVQTDRPFRNRSEPWASPYPRSSWPIMARRSYPGVPEVGETGPEGPI